MRLKLVFSLTFCFVTLPVLANIGESREQLVARYGKAEEVKPEDAGGLPGVLAFTKDGFYVHAEVYRGRCEYIMLAKQGSAALSPSEVETLLKANGGKRIWQAAPADKDGVGHMRTSDGELEAHLNATHDILLIRTKEAAKRHQAISKAAGQF